MAYIAVPFDAATDAELQVAAKFAGAHLYTKYIKLLIKKQLTPEDRALLIRHLSSCGYKSIKIDDRKRLKVFEDFVPLSVALPMYQDHETSARGKAFLKDLGFTSINQLANFARQTLRFEVKQTCDQAIHRLMKQNRSCNHLGFKVDSKDLNQLDGRRWYDEYMFQVLQGQELLGFLGIRRYRGESNCSITLHPLERSCHEH